MPKRSRTVREPDVNVLAAGILKAMTEGRPKPERAKNPAAVALGRLGGLKGGKARSEKLSKKRKSEIAKFAAKVRWSAQ